MPCEYPRTAFQGPYGGPLSFKPPPPGFNGSYLKEIQIPCGSCDLCNAEKSRQTAIRIYHEAQLHEENSFLTLTYADKHLPAYSSLRYSDVQKFYKRLRKHMGIPLRHYTVGEYGDKSQRPHYHACLFGHAFTEDRRILRTEPTLLWTSPLLEAIWDLGQVSVGALNWATAAYTASYVVKKLSAKHRYKFLDEATGELIEVEQPRARASKRLAHEWLARYGNQVYAHDQVVIDGRAQKPPRHYDKWLSERSKIALEMIKEKRREGKKLTRTQIHARAENARARRRMRKDKAI